MRLMWLWFLLYTLGAGFVLFFPYALTALPFLEDGLPSGVGHYIVMVSLWIGLVTLVLGFVFCFMGSLLLLTQGTEAHSKVVSLIGIGCYYACALVCVLLTSIYLDWDYHTVEKLPAVVFVFLPGFFIALALWRAMKSGEE